jgi:hypothetical protein
LQSPAQSHFPRRITSQAIQRLHKDATPSQEQQRHANVKEIQHFVSPSKLPDVALVSIKEA